jgi:hypothetical protein
MPAFVCLVQLMFLYLKSIRRVWNAHKKFLVKLFAVLNLQLIPYVVLFYAYNNTMKGIINPGGVPKGDVVI